MARPAAAPQGAPGPSLTEKIAAAWQQQQGVDASRQEPNIRGPQQQLGRGGLGHLAGSRQRLAVAALPQRLVSNSLPEQQAAGAPQQQQRTSGRLRQPSVRASAVGQAVAQPPPPAASVLQPGAATPPPRPTAAAPRPWLATAAPAPQGTVNLHGNAAALMPQQHSPNALERPHTAAPDAPEVQRSLPDVEQAQPLGMLWQAQLQYRTAVEALFRTAEELQLLPGVQQILHCVQDDVQVGACLAGCTCWSAGTAAEPADASSMHTVAATEPPSLGHCMHCNWGLVAQRLRSKVQIYHAHSPQHLATLPYQNTQHAGFAHSGGCDAAV